MTPRGSNACCGRVGLSLPPAYTLQPSARGVATRTVSSTGIRQRGVVPVPDVVKLHDGGFCC